MDIIPIGNEQQIGFVPHSPLRNEQQISFVPHSPLYVFYILHYLRKYYDGYKILYPLVQDLLVTMFKSFKKFRICDFQIMYNSSEGLQVDESNPENNITINTSTKLSETLSVLQQLFDLNTESEYGVIIQDIIENINLFRSQINNIFNEMNDRKGNEYIDSLHVQKLMEANEEFGRFIMEITIFYNKISELTTDTIVDFINEYKRMDAKIALNHRIITHEMALYGFNWTPERHKLMLNDEERKGGLLENIHFFGNDIEQQDEKLLTNNRQQMGSELGTYNSIPDPNYSDNIRTTNPIEPPSGILFFCQNLIQEVKKRNLDNRSFICGVSWTLLFLFSIGYILC